MEAAMPFIPADTNAYVKSNIEMKLRMSFGILLAFISMILTVALFISLAGDNLIRQIIMIGLAFGLEGSKLLMFRMGKGFKLIAVCLIIISIIASFGSALMVVEVNQHVAAINASSDQTRNFSQQSEIQGLRSIDIQIDALVGRLKDLPPNFISVTKDLTASIAALREQRGEVMRSIIVGSSDAPAQMTVTMFSLISRMSSISEDGIILAILMLVAVILEVSILALTQQNPSVLPMKKEMSYSKTGMSHSLTEMSYTQGAKNDDRTSLKGETGIIPQTIPQTPPTMSYEAIESDYKDEFLKAMIDEDTYPTLRGRDATAQRLGIPAYRAKTIVNQLIQDKKIRVEGKRLVMCGTVLPPDSEDSLDMEVGLKLDS